MSFEVLKEESIFEVRLPPRLPFSLLCRGLDYKQTCEIWDLYQKNPVAGQVDEGAILFAILQKVYVGWKDLPDVSQKENLTFELIMGRLNTVLSRTEKSHLAVDLLDFSALALKHRDGK